jgi:heptose-I-phosphate ethanolaminephosphotransferase
VAAAIALPLVLAVPSHQDARWEWNAALWALIGGAFLAIQFAARHVARLPNGARLAVAFAALYLVLGVLGFTSEDPYRLERAVTDLALLYLIFFCAAAAGRVSGLAGRALLAALGLALSLAAMVQAVHWYTFGFAIGADAYRAILQSNAVEALEFANRFLDVSVIATAAVALTVAAAAAFGALPVRFPPQALAWGGLYALAAVAILGGHGALVSARVLLFAEAVDYAAEIAEYRTLRKARRVRAPELHVTQAGPLAGQPQVYVFVVGESLSRNHMSLYGYWRRTTPSLERLASEMAVFDDVVSPHSHTDQSLELVLTLASQANRLRFTDPANYSVLELLRAAGFATWWISNQNAFGPWDNKTSVLGGGADHVHYTGPRSGQRVTGPLDAALVEPFAAALRDPAPRKAIFLHFLGNHWEYDKRYPPQDAAFRAPPSTAEIGALRLAHGRLDLINAYDNAVHYHDRLAAQVVEMLRAARQPAAMVLFSDHGESVYGLKGHYWREFTHDHVEVPLLIWFSPEYAGLAADTVARARANARAPFALEDMPHLVADLLGLHGAVFESRRSPLSGDYRAPSARPLFDRALIYEQADGPALNARRALHRIGEAHPELLPKLWAHRVDTLGKMSEAARLFAGAEIDVLYDPRAGTLMVNHPPEPLSGLTLEAQLAHSSRLNPGLALWLDVKNLTEANGARVLQELDRLDARYAIRARSVVETDHTGPAAAALRQAGYRSSYYLSTTLVTQNAGAQLGFSCYGSEEVQHTILKRRFAAISYDWRGRRWVERCLGGFVRERALLNYVWDLEPILSDSRAHSLLTEDRLKAYAGTAGVLLPYRTPFDDTP